MKKLKNIQTYRVSDSRRRRVSSPFCPRWVVSSCHPGRRFGGIRPVEFMVPVVVDAFLFVIGSCCMSLYHFTLTFLFHLSTISTLPSMMGANSVCNRWVTYTFSFSFLYSCARSLTPFIHFAFMKRTRNRSQHLSVYSPTEV